MSQTNNPTTKTKVSFPNWGYVHFSIISEMEKKYGINFDYKNLRLKYQNLLKDFKERKETVDIVSNIIKDIKFKTQKTPIDLSNIINNIEKIPEWSNQFLTIFNIRKFGFEYVQPNIERILNIKPVDFTIAALYGQDPYNKFYHPEDILMQIRSGPICYLVIVLCGLELDASTVYLHQKFRMRVSNYNSGKYFIVDKKAYLIKDSVSNEDQSLMKHMYYWNIIDETNNFNKILISFNKAGENKEYFLNQMFHVFNAQLYGFSTKEIFFLYYWNKHSRTKEICSHLNKKLNSDEFTPRKVSDFIYRLSKKIIKIYKENIILREIDEETQKTFISANALTYALKLGLLDFDESIIVKIGESALTN